MDAEKVKPSVFFAGWCQEGHLACKTLHRNSLLGKSRGNWLIKVYRKIAIKMEYVYTQ